jgi:hypothetical protein
MKLIRRLPMIWVVSAQVACVLHHKDRRLVMSTNERDGDWHVLVVEGANEGPEGFLGDHGHDYAGKFPDLRRAQEYMETYAARWLKKQVKIEACACKALRNKKAPRSKRVDRSYKLLDRAR